MGDPNGLTETAIYGVTVGLALPMLKQIAASSQIASVALTILLLLAAPLWLANLRFPLPERAYPFMIWHLRLAVLFVALGFVWALGSVAIKWFV